MFESPWMLLGLGAAGFILLAHRLFRQPAKKVRLASLRLVPLLQEEPLAPKSWQDLGLMALRLLFWVLLALALGRPHCAVSQDIEVYQDPQAALIVLDAGARTHHPVKGKPLWEHSIERAQAVINALPSGSWISLTALEPTLTQVSVGSDKNQAQVLLNAWKQAGPDALFARQGRMVLADAYPSLRASMAKAPSDLPRVGYFIAEPNHPSVVRCPAGQGEFQQWICLGAVPNASIEAPKTQLAITDLDIRAKQQPKGSTFELQAKIQNFGAAPQAVQAVDLQWYIDDQPMQRQHVTLNEGRGKSVWFYGVNDTESHRVRVELVRQDGFLLDNAQERWLEQERPLKILLVDGDPSEQRANDEVYLLATALQQAFKGRGISVRGIDPAQFEPLLDPAKDHAPDYDLIVLANVNALSKAHSDRLAAWVRKGLGLWITAGSRVEAQAYNQNFDALLPLRLRSGSASAQPPLALAAPELRHPLFSSFLDPGTLVGGRTSRLFLLEPDPKRDAKVALRFSNGAPVLVTRSVGQGRVAWWSTSIDLAWTDLVLHPGFVSLGRAIVAWLLDEPLSQASTHDATVEVGTSLILSSSSRVRVQGPHKDDTRWIQPGQGYRPARLGLYQSTRGNATQSQRFCATLDPRASLPPTRASVAPSARTKAKVQHRTSYRPIWAYLWPFVALALVSESLLRMLRLRR